MRRTPRRKRKRNKGWFRKGPDARRHVFTTEECRLGLWIAYANATPEVAAWLRLKLHTYYAEKNRGKPKRQEEARCAR
jgi:hypothetical protein